VVIIVDAYNLLHAMPRYKKSMSDSERARFIAELSAYGKRKGHKIVIVFDGGPYDWPFKENMKTVQIIYSGMHETADDYIKEYLEAHKAKDILLVSSDTELNRRAQYHNIPSIDSGTFARLMWEELTASKRVGVARHNKVVKLAQDNEFGGAAQEMLDKLMTEASKQVAQKSEDFILRNKPGEKKKQVSKEERVLLEKLKKL
jgi:predicted RNA-binding protein with PIN domain